MNNYNNNVFINCPFDKDYSPFLKVIFFTIYSFKLIPRIATERFDSSEVRFTKIKELIEESRYGIHDFSRIKSSKKNDYFRLNMPFELGIDIAAKCFLTEKNDKSILILEAEERSVQKAMSDLSFGDCKCHHSDAETLIKNIREWFIENGLKSPDSPSRLWNNYNFITSAIFAELADKGFTKRDIDNISTKEYLGYIRDKFLQPNSAA